MATNKLILACHLQCLVYTVYDFFWITSDQLGKHRSLNMIKELYIIGHASKEDYTKALQSYQEYLGEIKSDQRDKAAAFSDEYKYY